MDNPGASLFQGPDIKINNSQNNEEEEDLEDQKRRKEELQNLLTAALDDFNYDESTVNSSTNISVVSLDDVQNIYKQVAEPSEQLKLLYEVRLKEITNLKDEYSSYKEEKAKEINAFKNKLLLLEAEIRQLKISQKNSEDLLVEKTNSIKELCATLNNKDIQIKEYENTIENFKFEVCTYQSTINDLQIELQKDNSPFNLGAKKFNSEELQKAHQEQVIRLETLLNDQIKSTNIIEKERAILQQDLQNLIEQKNKSEKEDENTINSLSRTLDDAQQQCKDLIDVVEMLTKENQHMQDRINISSKDDLPDVGYMQPMDNSTLLRHIEKLKKMVLDKSVQIDSLNSKLKHYESDMKQLLEYRQLKCDVYKKDFQQCENKEHTKSLLLMQNDLQNYRRTIEDKNQQILTLNSTNRDLQEKIEEMLLQTRNDIQNLSHKYSLPQLEQMTQELKSAEENVEQLQEQLSKSEEIRASLLYRLENCEKDINMKLQKEFESQLLNLKNSTEKDKINFENQIMKLQKDLDISSAEIKSLKQFNEALIDENAKLKLDLKEQTKLNKSPVEPNEISDGAIIKTEYDHLKQQLDQVMAHLEKNKNQKQPPVVVLNLKSDMETFLNSIQEGVDKEFIERRIKQWKQQLDSMKFPENTSADEHEDSKQIVKKLQKANMTIKTLEETIDDLKSAKTIAEGEKCTFQFQVKDCENQLEYAYKTIKYLEAEVESLTKTLEEKEETVNELENNSVHKELAQLKEELNNKESALKICEQDKAELNALLNTVKLQLEESRKEVFKLQKETAELSDKAVRRNLEKELKEAENHLEQSRNEDGDVYESEHFKKCLQTEILKNELKLREDLQQEYVRKTKEVEAKYQKACVSTTDLYREQMDKMKSQEERYREHLSKILAECARKIYEFENEKQELMAQMNYVRAEYDEYKKHAAVEERQYKQMIKKVQIEAEKNVEEWKKWSKQFVHNCLKIETINKTSRDNILLGMKSFDSEVALIEKSYKEKLKRYMKNEKK